MGKIQLEGIAVHYNIIGNLMHGVLIIYAAWVILEFKEHECF